MYNYLKMHQELYHNQYKYRSLVVSLPLLLKQNLDFRKQYSENQSVRKETMYNELKSLFLAGYMQGTKIEILDMVLHSIIMIGRLWVIEANLDYEVIIKEEVINSYLKRLCKVLELVASQKGQEEITQFLNGLK